METGTGPVSASFTMQAIKLYFHPRKWPITRIIQLVIGAGVAINGFSVADYTVAGVGLLFTGMALLNYGCGACRGNQCEI